MEGVVFYFPFEPVFMQWLQGFMGPVLTAIASFFTVCGEELVVVGILAFLYWVWDKESAVFLATNVLAGTVLNPMLKNLALRRRPYMDFREGGDIVIRCLKPAHDGDIYDITVQGYSFPSGHSSNATIMYGSMPVCAAKKKLPKKDKRFLCLRIIALVMPLLVGFSRIVLGVHYPTDVLTGIVSGILIVCVVSFLQNRIPRTALHLLLIVLALPGFFFCKTNDFYTCFGIMTGFFCANELDTRVVRFKETRNVRAAILRLAIGLACFFALNTLFKVPFSKEFLSSATTAQFLFRAMRYFLVSFLMLGVYPACFRKFSFLR